jgi:hypothetical protein
MLAAAGQIQQNKCMNKLARIDAPGDRPMRQAASPDQGPTLLELTLVLMKPLQRVAQRPKQMCAAAPPPGALQRLAGGVELGVQGPCQLVGGGKGGVVAA